MLRLQQERVLKGFPKDKNRAYQPPWTDKNFYLMDGFGRRQILVDESDSPHKFQESEQDPEKIIYLRPTAGKLGSFNKNLEQYRVNNDEKPIQFKPERAEVYENNKSKFHYDAWKGDNCKLANPMKINPDWEDVVRKLDWNLFEKFYPIRKQEILKLQKGQKDARKNSTSSAPLLIARCPQEVWENVISNLDGLSFLRLADAFANLGVTSVLWDAHLANGIGKKAQAFWRNTLLQSLPHYYEIITSYSNVIVEGDGSLRRFADPTPYHDASLDYDSQDVVEARHDLIQKLTLGELTIKNMTILEEKIKMNIQLHHQNTKPGIKWVEARTGRTFNEVKKEDLDDVNKPRTYSLHTFIFDTIGSICYYIINPSKSTNLIIMEDLEKCEDRRVTMACNSRHVNHGILYTKIMYFPRYNQVQPTNSPLPPQPDDSLPELDRLIFSVCRKCTTARSTDGRTGFSYTHEVNEEELAGPYNNRMDPILAFHEDVFVLWHSPGPIELHKVKRVTRHYVHEKFQQLFVKDGNKYWDLLGNYTQHFIPVLKKVQNTGSCKVEKTFIQEFFGDKEAEKDYYYELHFVSMRLGTDSISLRNSHELKPKPEGEFGPSQPHFDVFHQNPQYYYNNALECRSLLDVCYSGCTGHGLYIFWNHKALACSCGDGTVWMFHSWKKALSSLVKQVPSFVDSGNLFVSQITVCSREVLAAIVNENVVIFKTLNLGGKIYEIGDERYADEPSFTMTPLRLVVLDLMFKNMSVEQLTFSYDKGEPYFTIQYRDKGTKCPLAFWISRLCFTLPDPEAALESISTLMKLKKEEEEGENKILDSSALLKKYTLPEAIAITMIGCKFLNLKKRIDIKPNNNNGDSKSKSYSQLVDEMISDFINEEGGNLDLSDYPGILCKAIELAENSPLLLPQPQPSTSRASTSKRI